MWYVTVIGWHVGSWALDGLVLLFWFTSYKAYQDNRSAEVEVRCYVHTRYVVVVAGDCYSRTVPSVVVVHCSSDLGNFGDLAEGGNLLHNSAGEDTVVVGSFADNPVVLHCSKPVAVGRRNRLVLGSRTLCNSIYTTVRISNQRIKSIVISRSREVCSR